MAFIFATCTSGASAQTIETNIAGLVVKNYGCGIDNYSFLVVQFNTVRQPFISLDIGPKAAF
jgi:hypothetical protein